MKPTTQSAGAAQIQAAYQQAVRLQNAGKIREAVQIYMAILQKRELAEPSYQLGRIAARTGRADEAAKWFRRALKVKPRQIEIWSALIDVLEGKDRAVAVKQARDLGVLLTERATALMVKAAEEVQAGREKKAGKLYRDAIDAGADAALVYEKWVIALYQARELDRALEVVDEGLTARPDEVGLILLRSSIFESLGRIDDAEQDLIRTLERKPYHAAAWNSLMRLRKQAPGSPQVETLKQRIREAETDPEAVRYMSYALAKALEDQGEYAEVFRHLDRGNALTRAKFPWGFDEDYEWLRRAIAAWKPMDGGYTESAPIFVTGLPRSGTTLVETILASHSAVLAGGEAGVMTPILRDPLEAWMSAGTGMNLAAIGRDYTLGMRRKLGVEDAAIRITDKSISTFSSIGYVLNALPRAKFVVLERDRRDVGLSIYKNLFRDGTHRYANNLSDIARQIRLFDAAVAAWRARVPDAIHVVDYQALTADPEPHIRALLEFCGLPWEEACLTPENAARNVYTLSSVQVRQPINRGSVDAWKRFEAELQPLIEALDRTAYDFG